MINITIGGKQYKVKEAYTEEKKRKGLMGIKELPKDQGMIFYYEVPDLVQMWMKDTYIPLDIIFINSDQEVISVKQGIPEDNTLIEENDVAFVVEVNANSGIKAGDELEFNDDDDFVMSVLNKDGTSQMNLLGGERIVSRRETKVLLRKAKKARESHSNSDFKSLGKYIFKVFKRQDDGPSEYVQHKN